MKGGGGKCDKSNSKVRFYWAKKEEKNNNEPQMQTLGNLDPLVFKSGKDVFTHSKHFTLHAPFTHLLIKHGSYGKKPNPY